MTAPPLVAVDDLDVAFEIGGRLFAPSYTIRALTGVSFEIGAGETLGVVGESGCGKSTLGRAILRLIEPTGGRVRLAGEDITALGPEPLRARRRDMQVIFQDPIASLDPRMTVGEIVGEPLGVFEPHLSKRQHLDRVAAAMKSVGLSPGMMNRYPHEFSGGQAQRIAIARALILRPRLIVCDEPVSSLDVSIQAQIINLLAALKRDFGLTLMFISHDLSVVRHIADRILVLYLGRVVELAARDTLFANPRHPYTRALLSAALVPDPKVARARPIEPLAGEVPSPINPPSGCAFRTRCAHARERCATERPALRETDGGAVVACHFFEDLPPARPAAA